MGGELPASRAECGRRWLRRVAEDAPRRRTARLSRERPRSCACPPQRGLGLPPNTPVSSRGRQNTPPGVPFGPLQPFWRGLQGGEPIRRSLGEGILAISVPRPDPFEFRLLRSAG